IEPWSHSAVEACTWKSIARGTSAPYKKKNDNAMMRYAASI
ncbi:MAG: hypothetical protein QOG21_1376, partial [Actinomycetota bacterium]|nr:hypothetical protein [Actinomycetota bacterium]